MPGNDLAHDFLLHKTPHLIACRALVIREEFFDGVVIQRGHVVRFRNYAELSGHATLRQRPSLRPMLNTERFETEQHGCPALRRCATKQAVQWMRAKGMK